MSRCRHPMPADGVTYECRRDADHGESPHAICGDSQHRHGATPCTVFGDPLGADTPMLDAVRGDLAGIKVDSLPGGRTNQAMALRLAAVIDKRGDDDGPSTVAKLADQLSKVMQQLTKGGGGGPVDDFSKWSEGISTPTMG